MSTEKLNNSTTNELPLVLTVPQLAKVLNIGRNAAYELVKSGEIRSIHIGKSIRIPRDALMEYLGKNS